MTLLLGDNVDANFTSTASSYPASAGEHGYPLTVLATGTIDTLHIRMNTSGTSSGIRLILRNSSGVLLTTGTVAVGENVTRSVSVTPVACMLGETLRLHFSNVGGSTKPYQNAVTGTVAQDSSSTYASPETTFVADSTPGALRQFQMWATGTLPSFSITSVNDDDELDSGAVNTAEVVGYDAGVNPIVSGTVGSLAVTDVSQTGTEAEFTIPAPTDAAYWPEPDATATLTLTDGTDPATFDALFNSIPGYTSVVIASPDNDDQYKLGYWATFPLEDGDRVMFDPPNPAPPDSTTGWTVNADGSYQDAPDGVKVWYHWRTATSLMYIYEATVGGGVVVDNRGLSVVGLSVTGLSVAGLSVAGL